jgi:hypothetical protein
MPTMSTVPPLARSYEALRPIVLQRLLEMRTNLDPALARLDGHAARDQIAAVLEHFGNFIATGDLALHRAFLRTFLAMRAAEAQAPAAVLATLVAIGDTAAQVAQESGGGGAAGGELTLLLTRVTASTARVVNELIADELTSRLAQWREVRDAQPRSKTPSAGKAPTGSKPR